METATRPGRADTYCGRVYDAFLALPAEQPEPVTVGSGSQGYCLHRPAPYTLQPGRMAACGVRTSGEIRWLSPDQEPEWGHRCYRCWPRS